MRRTIGLVGAAMLFAGCAGPNRQITAKYDAQLGVAKARAFALLVSPKCVPATPGTPPYGHCGLIADDFEKRRDYFVENTCGEDSERPMSAPCLVRFLDAFADKLQERYPDADFKEALARCRAAAASCRSMVRYELEVLGSHNEHVIARFHLERDELQAAHDTEQLDDYERRQAAARVLAGALHGTAEVFRRGAAQSAAPTSYSAPTYPVAAPSCSSDYECGTGRMCVKPQYAMQGTCAQSVNAYGTPTYAQPRPRSIGPGEGNCSFDTDCGAGFRCEKVGGAMRGNCLR